MVLVRWSRVSTEAVACPHCGVAQSAPSRPIPLIPARKGIMDKETFNSIRRCLHPDSRQTATVKRLNEAFDAFMALEKLLLNEKDSPTQFGDLHNTYAGWVKMKQAGKRHPALLGGLLVICIAAGIWVLARGGPNSGGQSALVATLPVRVNPDSAAATVVHEGFAAEWAAQFEQQAEVKTQESRRDKTATNETAADGDKTLIKVSPKTETKEDMEAAAQAAKQAAEKAKKKQAAEKAKQELAVQKVEPPPATGKAEIYLAQEAIRKIMREPSSAVFEDVFFVNDRKSETGDYVPVVCGTVNGRAGSGRMTGSHHFVALMDKQAQALWLEGSTPQKVLAREWNRFCAGSHNETIASAIRQAH
jgi:hypothetical protein